MTYLDSIARMLSESGSRQSVLPPTALFNEGWMLRLVLDWISRHSETIRALQFLPESTWYSEALLPSRFFSETRGDGLGEGYTHADAVIGHFRMRQGGRGDIETVDGGSQLVVVEAKMGSLLSPGTANARNYNQAARNVACIAHLVGDARRNTSDYARLGFFVLAPERRIREGVFAALMDKHDIEKRVRERASAFGSKHDEWLRTVFSPTLAAIEVEAIGWESVLTAIGASDTKAGTELGDFYDQCLKYNPLIATGAGQSR